MAFKAKDIMTRQIVTVREDASVDDVCELLLRYRISGVPVVNNQGDLAGIVTEYDLLSLLSATDHEHRSVSEVLSKEVVTVDEDEPLTDVADRFLDKGLRRLPVVKNGRLTGVISRRDLVRFIRDVRQRVRLEINVRRDVRAELANAGR
jgi:CBS domain-containing protein